MGMISVAIAGLMAAATSLMWGRKTGTDSALTQCDLLKRPLWVQHMLYNTTILKDFPNLGCTCATYYLFDCCHGHQHLNKLLIKNSISVMQHGPHFTSSSTLTTASAWKDLFMEQGVLTCRTNSLMTSQFIEMDNEESYEIIIKKYLSSSQWHWAAFTETNRLTIDREIV